MPSLKLPAVPKSFQPYPADVCPTQPAFPFLSSTRLACHHRAGPFQPDQNLPDLACPGRASPCQPFLPHHISSDAAVPHLAGLALPHFVRTRAALPCRPFLNLPRQFNLCETTQPDLTLPASPRLVPAHPDQAQPVRPCQSKIGRSIQRLACPFLSSPANPRHAIPVLAPRRHELNRHASLMKPFQSPPDLAVRIQPQAAINISRMFST